MEKVLEIVEGAKLAFRKRLTAVRTRGGLTKDDYVRYLSFQHHLTNGVQKHFLACAAHPRLANKRKLRDFLISFGLEEEPHYYVAELDLRQMGLRPLPCPLDVALWWCYFDQIVRNRPFVRLGATCVLENLGAGAGALGRELLNSAPFLNKQNTRFLEIHFHEVLPHGDQIINALRSATLDERDVAELVEGAKAGAVLYLRMVEWALGMNDLSTDFPVELHDWRPRELEEPVYADIDEKSASADHQGAQGAPEGQR